MKRVLVVLIAVLAVADARAETIVISRPNGAAPAPARGQRVTVNITLATPTPGSTVTSDWASELANANRSLYDIMGQECVVLSAVLKGECRLAQIQTTGNISDRPTFGGPQAGGSGSVNVNATATFEVEPKATPTPPATK